MNLLEFVERDPTPVPWAEGEKIPWNEPGFSARMLKEHLTQAHDAASRRFEIIDRQVEWIHSHLLGNQPVKVLDIACGPGLYASRLARRGCSCTGIDFGPASIAYARETAEKDYLDCRYIEGDIRTTPFGEGYGLAMLIYGEFNTFHPNDAALLLRKAHEALVPGGLIVLEPHPFEVIKAEGHQARRWYSTTSGLFSERPHIYLEECSWDEATCTATIRNFIVDAETGAVTHHACTMKAYTNEQYKKLLEDCGFQQVEFPASLEGHPTPETSQMMCITAVK